MQISSKMDGYVSQIIKKSFALSSPEPLQDTLTSDILLQTILSV